MGCVGGGEKKVSKVRHRADGPLIIFSFHVGMFLDFLCCASITITVFLRTKSNLSLVISSCHSALANVRLANVLIFFRWGVQLMPISLFFIYRSLFPFIPHPTLLP